MDQLGGFGHLSLEFVGRAVNGFGHLLGLAGACLFLPIHASPSMMALLWNGSEAPRTRDTPERD